MFKKSTRILLSVSLIVLMTFGTVIQSTAESNPWYRVETTYIYTNGAILIKSECVDIEDDDCNMVGSVHYIALPNFLGI